MTKESAKKASVLLEEIDELSKYKKFLSDRECGNVAHFAFVQHYGVNDSYSKIDIDKKHNHLFIPILDTLIAILEAELHLIS